MCSWYKCVRYFLEIFDSWPLRGLFDTDQETKENLATIKGIIMLDSLIDQCIVKEGPSHNQSQLLDIKQPDKKEKTRKISLL